MEGNQTAFETEFRKYFETAVSVVLIFECITGIIFNVATVHVILSFSKLQTPSNQLLLSLSLGDLCGCCTAPAVLAKLYFKHINDHNSWKIACFTFQGIMYLAVFLNFLTLFIIACEKLISIRYPLMARIWITMKRVRCLCTILWITGILSLIIVLVRWTHAGDDYNCWPDIIHEDIVWKYVIMTVFFLLSTLTYILYAYIGYMLYKRSHKGRLTPNPKPRHRNDLIFMNDVNGVISNLGVAKDKGEDDIVIHIKTKTEKDAKEIMSSDEINIEEIGRHNEKNNSANVDDLKDICNSKETPQEAKSIQKISSINDESENGFDRKISSTGIFIGRSGSRSSGNSIDGVSNRMPSSQKYRKRNSFQIILESKTVRMLFISMFVYYFLYLPNVITILLDADDIFRHLATVVFFCNYFINPVIYWFYPNFNEAYMSLLRNGRETRT